MELVDQMQEELLGVVLLVRVEFGLEIRGELLDLLLLLWVLDEVLNKFVQLIMERFFLVICGLGVLLLVKVEVELLN